MFEMHSSARKTIDMLWIVFGASLVALVSGTPNAFNTISHKLQVWATGASTPAPTHHAHSEQLTFTCMVQEATASSNTFISVLTGIGVAGLQMSLPGLHRLRFSPTSSTHSHTYACVTCTAGVLADNFGTHVACLAGAIAVVLGYVAMSFVTSEVNHPSTQQAYPHLTR